MISVAAANAKAHGAETVSATGGKESVGGHGASGYTLRVIRAHGCEEDLPGATYVGVPQMV